MSVRDEPSDADVSATTTARRPLIVHVIDRLTTGGMETVALNVIAHTRTRYRHQVVCLRSGGGLIARLEALGIAVTQLGKRPGKDIGAYRRLRRLLVRLRPAIVHTYNIGALDVAFWARLAGVRRVVYAEHGRDADDPDGRNRRYRMLRRIMAPLIRSFVAVSADLERWLTDDIGIAKTKVRLIRNGVDTERFRPDASARPPWPENFASAESTLIGTVGRLDPVKAFDDLIDAFAQVRARVPTADPRLVIIGDGPERDALRRRIDRQGLWAYVWMPGERDDIARILAGLDIYVCSSIAEGIALTILEAMASGLPVVATRVGGNPELVVPGQTGTLVPASDASALAAALASLAEDRAHRRACGKASRHRACDEFSIAAMVADYAGLYDQLLGETADNASNVVDARS